jgi:hypothetical protein
MNMYHPTQLPANPKAPPATFKFRPLFVSPFASYQKEQGRRLNVMTKRNCKRTKTKLTRRAQTMYMRHSTAMNTSQDAKLELKAAVSGWVAPEESVVV